MKDRIVRCGDNHVNVRMIDGPLLTVVVSIPKGPADDASISSGAVNLRVWGATAELAVRESPGAYLIETQLAGGATAHAIYRFDVPASARASGAFDLDLTVLGDHAAVRMAP